MKLFRYTALVTIALLAVAPHAHADTKISAMPAAAALSGTDAVPAVQGVTNVKTTPAAIDTYVKTLGATLGVAKGGTNLTASADDNVMVGNGTTWQTKAIPTCTATTNGLLYNTATNVFSCNTSLADVSSGTFTATWATGFTASQTQNFAWAKSGNVVTLRSTSNLAGTSNATSVTTAAAQLPAAITPAADAIVAVSVNGIDNGSSVVACIRVRADGSIQYGVLTVATNNCATTGWTASGAKQVTASSAAGLGVYVYSTN